MRPRWCRPSRDRDLQVPLSPSPSENLACGVGCPQAPGSPGGGRYMARENVQGSIIRSEQLISGYMTPPPFSPVNCTEAASDKGGGQERVFLKAILFLIYLNSKVGPRRRWMIKKNLRDRFLIRSLTTRRCGFFQLVDRFGLLHPSSEGCKVKVKNHRRILAESGASPSDLRLEFIPITSLFCGAGLKGQRFIFG